MRQLATIGLLVFAAMTVAAPAQETRTVAIEIKEGETFFLQVRLVGSRLTVERLPFASATDGSTPTIPPVPNDRIAKAAAAAIAAIPDYPGKRAHAGQVAALFTTFAESIKQKKLEGQATKDINDALSTTATLMLGKRADDWKGFFSAVGQELQAVYGGEPTRENLLEGYMRVAAGVTSDAAIDTKVIKVILQVVLTLIDEGERPKLAAILKLIIEVLPAEQAKKGPQSR